MEEQSVLCEGGPHRAKAALAWATVGFLLGTTMWAAVASASVTDIQIPIPNPTRLTIKASVVAFRHGGGDSLILDLKVDVSSGYQAGTISIVSGRVVAYDDADIASATKYARVGFHHVVIGGGERVTLMKTVRVHHASMAALDHDAYLVATATNKVDGMVLTAQDAATVDVADFIARL